MAYRFDTVGGILVGVSAGLGVGLLPCFAGDRQPSLLRLNAPIAALGSDLWLLTHPDLHGASCIRANALGIAVTQAAGLRLQFASEVKPLHAELAARARVLAIELARAGLDGNAAFLDGRLGFFAVLGLGGVEPERCVG